MDFFFEVYKSTFLKLFTPNVSLKQLKTDFEKLKKLI